VHFCEPAPYDVSIMHTHGEDRLSTGRMAVTDEVVAYIEARKCDFRISTSCGGPILLPVSMKPPKKTDVQVKAGTYLIFISIHQAPYIQVIHRGLIPLFYEYCDEHADPS
jgi:hypothetical protein